MPPDRSWMFCRRDPTTGRVSEEFQDGVDDFTKFVKEHPEVFDSAGHILCPCARCKNCNRMETFWVEQHLYSKGFMANYVNWTAHGEELWGANSSRHMEAEKPKKKRRINDMGNNLAFSMGSCNPVTGHSPFSVKSSEPNRSDIQEMREQLQRLEQEMKNMKEGMQNMQQTMQQLMEVSALFSGAANSRPDSASSSRQQNPPRET